MENEKPFSTPPLHKLDQQQHLNGKSNSGMAALR
jgi:hypothetical protein